MSNRLSLCFFGCWLLFCPVLTMAGNPLPSWNQGEARDRILRFVQDVTTPGKKTFVPEPKRIAVFDNDGTLWVEKPLYTQLVFVMDRVEALAEQHPEWHDVQPFQAALEKDYTTLATLGEKGLFKLLMATHSGMTIEEFDAITRTWLQQARHPRFGRAYTELIYQPMVELLVYLRANAFKTYIVSGGGVSFMRPFTEAAYGIPPEQVIGSSIRTRFEYRGGKPVLVRQPELFFFDDKEGKPVAIEHGIGRRPILAFGNSDGDLQMLQWNSAGPGESLGLILHHTDGKREYAYDREGHVGRLNKALDQAGEQDWVVVDMAKDWNRVFLFDGIIGQP